MSKTRKPKAHSYSVKFQIKAIIGVDVVAASPEEAIEKAKEFLSKNGRFVKGVDYLDGKEYLVGYDDNGLWREIS